MPPLRLTNGIIEKACELRAYGGSDGACARHARVTPPTFYRWLHFGQVLRDYVDNGNEFYPAEYYRTWSVEAKTVIAKLRRELEETEGILSKEHKSYLRLWDKMLSAQDDFISECHTTIDKAKNIDPNWALRGLRWFYPRDYQDSAAVSSAEAEKDSKEKEVAHFSLPISVIAPSFIDVYDDIVEQRHTEYVLYGGRGSTKSSFISLMFVYLIKNFPDMHMLASRQVKDTLRDSVYSQVQWALTELGFEDDFKCTTSPLEITYLPTGQKIYFRGADEPGKIKSIKPAFGYIGGLWFEELDQFHGEEAIRKIEQSAIRGGDLAYIFKSFNPPRTAANWANKYIKIPKENQYQHKSTYLQLGSRIRWLGKVFVEEAEHLKLINPKAYEHEYLGEVNGTGGMVFDNVQLRKIEDDEIAQFDRILMGNDWGYFPDPYAWVKCHYDAARLTLYIFDELHALKASNRDTAKALKEEKKVQPDDMIIADSAEPKSVADYREYGLNCYGAEKGADSVKYSMKWLQSLAAIVIDNERAPNAANEFINYELEQDKDGNFISEYPDRDNHFIDAVRYATNKIWRRRGQ